MELEEQDHKLDDIENPEDDPEMGETVEVKNATHRNQLHGGPDEVGDTV